MNESIMDRFLGLNWRTTIGGVLAAAGGVLAASAPPGRWQVAGQVASAVGVALIGLAARDRNVTSAQMQDRSDAVVPKPPVQFPPVSEIKQP